MRHRAKILSHKLQCHLRKKKEEDAKKKERKKVVDELIKCNNLHKDNTEATIKICASVPNSVVQNIEDVPIECFKKALVKELKAFIHAWMFPTASIPKGKLSLILSGKENLMRVAHESKTLLILLNRPNTDDEGNVVLDDEVNDDEGGDYIAIDDEGDDDVAVCNEEDECNLIHDGCIPPRLIVESNTTPIVTPPRATNESNMPPSYHLRNTDYILLLKANIRGTHRVEELTTTEEKMHYADKIGRLLHRRLAKHI